MVDALVGSACAASGSTAETSTTGAAAYSFRSILSASDPVHVSAPANKPGWLYVVVVMVAWTAWENRRSQRSEPSQLSN